jgi:hypothetical protein
MVHQLAQIGVTGAMGDEVGAEGEQNDGPAVANLGRVVSCRQLARSG